jgi:3'5'-cyclic nucleotide phosphodiesterase
MVVTPLSTAEIEEILSHSPDVAVDFRDEMVEVISLPEFNGRAVAARRGSVGDGFADFDTLQLGSDALYQLRSFISAIGLSYRNNAFHNFEHASHVVMSVSKLLARISTPDMATTSTPTEQDVHNFGYGIASDPLLHFALAVAALIHDCDHEGVPNGQLVSEQADVAVRFKNKSVAEQNSLDIAWNILMRPEYEDLRMCIFSNKEEVIRFRKYLVQAVMATDIFDNDLLAFRESRWATAFKSLESSKPMPSDDDDDNKSLDEKISNDRRATIIIEIIMQASDVSHCMQVRQTCNDRLASSRAGTF